MDDARPSDLSVIPAWVDGALRPVGKLDAHRRALRHKAVSVFVTRGDRLLIQRRAAGKYHTPGLWANTCCTHPGWDETDSDCAHRRLAEELGIDGLTLLPRGIVEYRAEVGRGLVEHEVVAIFTGAADAALAVRPNPEEVAEWRWIALDALTEEIATEPDRFTPWLRIYMTEHRETIFGTG